MGLPHLPPPALRTAIQCGRAAASLGDRSLLAPPAATLASAPQPAPFEWNTPAAEPVESAAAAAALVDVRQCLLWSILVPILATAP